MKVWVLTRKFVDLSFGKFLRFCKNSIYPQGVQTNTVPRVNSVGYHMKELANIRSAEFALENLSAAVFFEEGLEYFVYCLKQAREKIECKSIINPTILEFGVWKGASINRIGEYFSDTQIEIFGFDSFEGLSENWGGTSYVKGFFDVGGKLPQVRDNTKLIRGWISETLPNFLSSNASAMEKLVLVNIDTDTFTPAKLILESLGEYLKPGTIIMFDEFMGYPFWEKGEYEAFRQFIQNTKLSFSYIAFTHTKLAIQIEP